MNIFYCPIHKVEPSIYRTSGSNMWVLVCPRWATENCLRVMVDGCVIEFDQAVAVWNDAVHNMKFPLIDKIKHYPYYGDVVHFDPYNAPYGIDRSWTYNDWIVLSYSELVHGARLICVHHVDNPKCTAIINIDQFPCRLVKKAEKC